MNMDKTVKRNRPYQVKFYVSEEEKILIETKMRIGGYKNMSKFLRQAIALYNNADR